MLAGTPDGLSKVIEGLITGIGFIGGGAILRREDSVKGTATAASLWITGAIGVAAGLGAFDVAFVLAVATVLTLWLLSPLKTGLSEPDDAPAPADGDGRDDPIER